MESNLMTPLSGQASYFPTGTQTPYLPSGVALPDPLLGPSRSHTPIDRKALARALSKTHPPKYQTQAEGTTEHGGVLLDPMVELGAIRSRSTVGRRPSCAAGLPDELGSPTTPISQGIPPEIPSLAAEVIFVLVISLRKALGISAPQTPWLNGSSLLASGLSVVIAGSLADLAAPKPLMMGAFIWEAIWNAVYAGAVSPRLKILFFIARAMQGLSVGLLVSASMSILGRVYKPGIRKTRVFSLMAAGAPFGFWVGCLQGGALSAHLPWIFGSTALFLVLCAVAAQLTLPDLCPAKDSTHDDVPSMRQFDYLGASISSLGCGLILFGLTQGSAAHWNPYTYSLIIVGVLMFVLFAFVERRVSRPLIPNELWKTPGFVALLVSYFLGFGAYSGSWQFYAIQFWQRYQGVSPLMVAFYFLPNGIVGVFAAWLVSKTLHIFPGHWIFFITSSVPRSYQGSAGALLVTVQNLTSAIMTSISDSIGVAVDQLPSGEVGLKGIRIIWWFGLASSLSGALITALIVRIPKAEEKEHVQ